MKNKIEIRDPKFDARHPIDCPTSDSSREPGAPLFENRIVLFEFLQRLRLPLPAKVDRELTAARNRAERIFEVNYRPTWIR